MDELTPITRIEQFLDGIVNSGEVPDSAVTRVETFLDCIVNNQTCALPPVTRIETYLAKISGADVVTPQPVTRIEAYLAKISGMDVEVPDAPITRVEYWLDEWANGGVVPEWATASGAIASFTTVRSAPLKELVANIEPVQSGSGDPSPDNVRPITGHTGLNVWVTGKNLIDKSTGKIKNSRLIIFGVNNFDDTVPNGSIKLEAGNYVLSLSGDNSTIAENISVYDQANVRIKVVYNNKICSFTVASTGNYRVYISISSANFVSWDNYDIQLEKGSTATAYEAYSGSSVSVSFDSDGTVYGGTLDVVSGELNKRPYYASYNGETLVGPWVSSMDKYVVGTTPTTGAQVVDMGGAETTVSLTGEAVSALLGQNNIWTDTGNVSVTYQSN